MNQNDHIVIEVHDNESKEQSKRMNGATSIIKKIAVASFIIGIACYCMSSLAPLSNTNQRQLEMNEQLAELQKEREARAAASQPLQESTTPQDEMPKIGDEEKRRRREQKEKHQEHRSQEKKRKDEQETERQKQEIIARLKREIRFDEPALRSRNMREEKAQWSAIKEKKDKKKQWDGRTSSKNYFLTRLSAKIIQDDVENKLLLKRIEEKAKGWDGSAFINNQDEIDAIIECILAGAITAEEVYERLVPVRDADKNTYKTERMLDLPQEAARQIASQREWGMDDNHPDEKANIDLAIQQSLEEMAQQQAAKVEALKAKERQLQAAKAAEAVERNDVGNAEDGAWKEIEKEAGKSVEASRAKQREVQAAERNQDETVKTVTNTNTVVQKNSASNSAGNRNEVLSVFLFMMALFFVI